MSSPPILVSPSEGEIITLYLVVSDFATSAALVRERDKAQQPVYYCSRALRGAEERYPKMEKLILALITVYRIIVCSQVHNTITKGLLSNPWKNCTIKLVGHSYEWIWIKTPIQIYDLLPKDYYLVPSNKTIKLECGFL